MKSNVVPLYNKRSFTSAEKVIDEVRNQIFKSNIPYKEIALKCNVSLSTVHNLGSGKTKWPRPTTLFPMLAALGMEMRIVKHRET